MLLFDNVLFICENKNGDIGVMECYKKCVIVVEKNGRKRFEYFGYIWLSSFIEFEFVGIGLDSCCNFVILDFKNYIFYVVDW